MIDFFSRIPEPLIQELYDIWRDATADGLPPKKAAFPIQELPHRMWPHLFFYDHTEDDRFFAVYNGTYVVNMFGTETTGHYMDDFISEDFANSILPLYRGTIRDGRGVYYRGDIRIDEDRYHLYARMLLPICNEEGDVAHILGMMIKTGEGKTYERPLSLERRDIIWDCSFGAEKDQNAAN